jgi:hypothetical protein
LFYNIGPWGLYDKTLQPQIFVNYGHKKFYNGGQILKRVSLIKLEILFQ